MPRCPGCQSAIQLTEILCRRCIYEDQKVRWPQCQSCYQWTASCGESGYRLCHPCFNVYSRKLHLAASPIQNITRIFLARRLLTKHKAAKSIQAIWRGYVTRSQLALQG